MHFPYSTALVTGASSGIGRSMVLALAAHGVDTVVVARRQDRLQHLAQEVKERFRVEVEPLVADLTETDQLRLVEERLADPSRPVELLVNNAGASWAGDFAKRSADGQEREIALNLVAPMRLSRAVLPRMIAAGHGGVLLVSSMVSKLPQPGSAVYGATKAALTSLGESLHIEVSGHGVHVTTLNVGLTTTEFHDAAGLDTSALPKLPWLDPAAVAETGLRAVAEGKPIAVPGLLYRIQSPVLTVLPRPILRNAMKRSRH